MLIPTERDIIQQLFTGYDASKRENKWENNPGNIRFFYWVLEKKDDYDRAMDKDEVIMEIAEQVEIAGGRFLLNTAKFEDGFYNFEEQRDKDATKVIRDAFEKVRPLDILGSSEERYRQPGNKIFHQQVQEKYDDYDKESNDEKKIKILVEIVEDLQHAGCHFFRKGPNNNGWTPIVDARSVMKKVQTTFRDYTKRLRRKVQARQLEYLFSEELQKIDIIDETTLAVFGLDTYYTLRNRVRSYFEMAFEMEENHDKQTRTTIEMEENDDNQTRTTMSCGSYSLVSDDTLAYLKAADEQQLRGGSSQLLYLSKNLAPAATGLQLAITMAKESRKWLLVNLQHENLACRTLNLQVWQNDRVESLIKKGFVFWQSMYLDPAGGTYAAIFSVQQYPHVAILDARTGKALFRQDGWENPITAERFVRIIMDLTGNADSSGQTSHIIV